MDSLRIKIPVTEPLKPYDSLVNLISNVNVSSKHDNMNLEVVNNARYSAAMALDGLKGLGHLMSSSVESSDTDRFDICQDVGFVVVLLTEIIQGADLLARSYAYSQEGR